MRKIILICLPLILFFVSCSDTVFSNIRKEVVLVPATVKGPVNSIVRFKGDYDVEYLLTQSGNGVYFKEEGVQRTGDSPVWKKRDSRFGTSVSGGEAKGEQIFGLAADSRNIYVIAQSIKRDTDEGKFVVDKRRLYYTNKLTGSGSDWKEITIPDISLSDCRLFCNNAIDSTKRKAYFRNGAKLYELNGDTTPTEKTLIDNDVKDGDKNTIVNSVVSFGSSDIFFGSIASTTNEKKENGTIVPATKYYYGSGSTIKYSDGTNPEESVSANGTVSCIAVTADSLLYGTGNPYSTSSGDGGIYKRTLDSNGIPGDSAGFSNNAQAIFTSSYQLLTLLAEDTSKPEADCNIFASADFKTAGGNISVSYNNVCLWAYYPKRGNWNRE